MNNRNTWLPRLAAGVLVAGTLLGVALAAGQQGSQSDPLVSLSYLTDKLTPDLLSQTDAKIAQREQALTENFDALIDAYTQEMESALAQSGGGGTSAAFSVVDVAQGQTLIGGVGWEIMLRVGTANCVSPTTPGLIDMTDGTTLSSGNPLVTNHLYMVTIADRGLTATSNVKVLVRGSYTIQ